MHNTDIRDDQTREEIADANTHPKRDTRPDGCVIVEKVLHYGGDYSGDGYSKSRREQKHTRIVILESRVSDDGELSLQTVSFSGHHFEDFTSELSYRSGITLHSNIYGRNESMRLSWSAVVALMAAIDYWKDAHPIPAPKDADDMMSDEIPF